ncbi:hypothetical protein ETB97_000996 [Aspergillus alliaceus]|uniref:DUF2293 domain-containing protein n=1 Tax=Petromyces alliaceus TaxID=209559 RepID=A0A8H6A4H0_PETAA|nr:hypothetical protein ETB97_000996 [Aspergillus burnettii]
MARVFRRPVSALARRAPGRAALRTTRKHKVIMESVTQEKKKLRSVISFEAKAPPGYTFIPAGNPQLTSACKELCRKDGLKVFAVTTTPHMHTHNLSQHVHRIGYHFPSAIVATACMDLGLYLTPAGKAMPFQSIVYTSTHKRTNSEISQTTINTEARDVLRDLFPNIPDNDLNQIIKTAFQKGQRKVGTAVELPLARRAQLAVVAHIRHVYTDYDRLLKTTSFHEARSIVEEPTLARLVEWRGDDENGKTVLEDVFREVIVISDDEDSDTEGDIPQYVDRDYSVEIVSSHPCTEDLQMKPVNYANPIHREHNLDISDEEAPPGFRFIRVAPRKAKIDRRGFSRYQAWDRAINRYRNGANVTDKRRPLDGSTDHGRPIYAAQQSLQENSDPGLLRAIPSRRISATPFGQVNSTGLNRSTIAPVIEHRVSPQGTLALDLTWLFLPIKYGNVILLILAKKPYDVYPITRSPHQREVVPEVVPLERALESRGGKPLFQQDNSPNAPVFVSGPKVIGNSGDQRGSQRALGPFYSRTSVNPQERVLPSIEPPLSPENKLPDSGPLDHFTGMMSGGFSIRSVTPHHLPHKDIPHHFIEDGVQDQLPKRRRLAYYETVNPERGHSRLALATDLADTSTRRQCIPLGSSPRQFSLQDDIHLRRKYLAPVDPLPNSEPRLGKVQLSNSRATRFDLKSRFMHPEQCETLGGQSLPRNHPVEEVHGRWRPPEQPCPLPGTRTAASMTYGSDRAVPVQSSNLKEQRICYPDHHHDSRTMLLEGSGLHKSSWTNGHDHILMQHENTKSRRHYADDFVRTIDSQALVPMEHPPQHRLRTHCAREPPIQRTCVQHPREPYKHIIPGGISSRPPPFRDPLESRVGPAVQGHATVDMRYPDAGLIESASAVGDYEGRFPNSSHSSRGRPQHTQELAYPTFVGRDDQSQPCHSMPEGRTVIIMD